VGSGGIAYAAYAGGDAGIALALTVVATLFGLGTLRSGRR